MADVGIPDTGAVPLETLRPVDGLIRCLVYGSCHVRTGEMPGWQTEWKWMVGVWQPLSGNRFSGPPSDASAWFIPSLHDVKGAEVFNVEISHVHALPEDPI